MKIILFSLASALGLVTLGFTHREPETKKDVPVVQSVHTECEEGDDEYPQPKLKGRVTDNTPSETPIYHACVEVRTSGGTFVGIIGTDANGHYYFNTLAPGTYNLTVSASGFTTQVVPLTIGSSPLIVNVHL